MPHLSDISCPQLFLEEEREKELEELYESGIADAMNRVDAPVGSGAEGGPINGALEAETGAVMKQTMGTLMAGERIMEALDLADKERETFRNYEAAMARLPENEALRMQPPPKNQVLVAYDLEPEIYVLKVVEKVPSTALQDALLVLPFGKVVSLMDYLDFWAQKVCFYKNLTEISCVNSSTGMEHRACFEDYLLSSEDASSPNRFQPRHANNVNSPSETFTRRFAYSEGCHRL